MDIKTLILLHFVISIINAGSVAIIWYQYQQRFAGVSLWLVNMILQVVGMALIIMRGEIADFISIVLANTLLLIGAVVFFIGLERFAGKKGWHIHNYILLAAFVCLITYYGLIDPDMVMREIIVSLMIGIISFQGCCLLMWKISPELFQITRITGLVLGCYTVVSLVRMVLLVVFPLQTNNFLRFGFADSLTITLYALLSICLTISIILMVNKRLLAEVRAQEEKFTTTFHSSPYAIMLTKLSDGTIIEVNDGFVNIFGYQYAEVIGKTILDLCIWSKDQDRVTIANELVQGNKVQGKEFQFKKKSGNMMTGLFSTNIIIVSNEKCLLSNISDITELSHMKQRLQVLATHDALTGLPNRTLFYERFDIALSNAQRNIKKMVIISLDLDNFKTINDSLGHDVGDEILAAAAAKMRGILRKDDTVARFGGDEFVLLLWEIDHEGDAIKLIEKILNGFRQPFIIGEYKLNLTASMGIAFYPKDGKEIKDLITKSDRALYYVKRNGRNNYQLYANC
ncbi:sensor domain-containing diguanylate cyclase [Pelosinus sp. IPA-1]|uniref:sensor domain-containing protein n=1 Tax=Pelosinus sp. IPA-1 TaxID=3029569 RepID=UPI002556DECC|nr:sensor domain-containing diguanylate cyclase [Pelosinus sp. IPA-1]